MLESYLIETNYWSCRIDLSDGIVVYADCSLKWMLGLPFDKLKQWLTKKAIDYKITRQERMF